MEILYTDDAGVLRVFAPDATMRESHAFDSEIVEHPVESGVNLVDHIRAMPVKLSVEFVVSNQPIEAPLGIVGATTGAVIKTSWQEFRKYAQGKYRAGTTLQFGPAQLTVGEEPADVSPATTYTNTQVAEASVFKFATPFDRMKDTLDLLDKIRLRAITVSVYTSLRVYENMAIARISAPREPEEMLTFTVEFTQIRTGSTKLVSVAPKVVAEKRAEAKKAAGPPAIYDLPEANQSIADSAVQALANLLSG